MGGAADAPDEPSAKKQKVIPQWAIREGMVLTAAQRGEAPANEERGGDGGGGGGEVKSEEGEDVKPGVSAEEDAEKARLEVRGYREIHAGASRALHDLCYVLHFFVFCFLSGRM